MSSKLGIDEWALIAPHTNFEDWLSFALICKKSRDGLKKHFDLKQNLKRCMKCNGKTFRHAPPLEESCYEEVFLKMGKEEFFCISEHSEKNEIWHICFKCDVFHLECPSCKKYCRLVGFPGQKKSDNDEINGVTFWVVEKEGKKVFEKFPDDMDFSDYYYDTGLVSLPEEWNILFLDRKKWYFTGKDGSRHSKMECKFCQYELYFNE